MAGALFSTIQFVHITGAAVVLGYLALAPIWRKAAARAEDPGVLRFTAEQMRTALARVVLPAFGIVFVSGIAMSFRATSDRLYDIRVARWLQASVLLAVVLGILLWGLLTPLRKMKPLLDAGETKGPATEKLWGEWRTSLLMASIVALVATAIMIYNTYVFP